MKFLAKFYYLPLCFGIIISIIQFIFPSDARLKLEGMAQLTYQHSLSDQTSNIYWEVALREVVNKFQNKNSSVKLIEKRGMLRFYSEDTNKEILKQEYLAVKNEIEKYKEDYLEYLEKRFKLDVGHKTFTKKMKNYLLKSDAMSNLKKKKFLSDLKINEIVIHNHQIIYVTLLISFFVTVILYNIKKIKF